MKRTLPLLLLLPVFAGCIKDRDFAPKAEPISSDSIVAGMFKVNEFVATNPTATNEFGDASDWFEIYNTTGQEITLVAGEWFVTDGGDAVPGKYELPEVTLPAHGFLVIWCDGLNTVANDIHSNFSLSSLGEELAIHHYDGTDYLRIDGYAYGDQTTGEHANGESNGRTPDGSETWGVIAVPTPGAPNP